MPESLGDRLRRLREQRNLSQEQLYSRTKILVKYIEALESGRWDLLPGQVYLKPFIKSIAEALDVNYKELYALIDQARSQKPTKTVNSHKKEFDYRWLMVLLMFILTTLVILLLYPLMSGERSGTDKIDFSVLSEKEVIKKDSKRYTTKLDLSLDFIRNRSFNTLELIATDTVWLLLVAGDDTLYTGILSPGGKINRGSFKPFELVMGKSNCLEVTYNNQKLDNEKYLRNRRHVKFSDLNLIDKDE